MKLKINSFNKFLEMEEIFVNESKKQKKLTTKTNNGYYVINILSRILLTIVLYVCINVIWMCMNIIIYNNVDFTPALAFVSAILTFIISTILFNVFVIKEEVEKLK